jgi:cytoskeleton protein RodZ
MSSLPFGEHLKREREMRGVSLEEIAAATRISTRFLEALEKEQWSELPGGVFNRGFIRAVSKYLGLDADDMVAEYAIETQQGVQQSLPQAHVVAARRSGAAWPKKSWVPAAALVVAVVGALMAAGWLVGRAYGPAVWARMHRSPVPAVSASGVDAGGLGPATATPTSPAANPVAPNGAASSASGDPAIVTAASGVPAAATTAGAEPLELKIEAGRAAHVQVFADGKSAFDGEVGEGTTKSFEARETFQVTSSEASALLIELNGRPMPPMGAPGQPGTVTLGRKDLQPAGGGAH